MSVLVELQPVIDIGVLVGFMITGLGIVWAMRGDIRMLARDVRLQGEKIEKLETIITKQAVQDQRLNELDRRIEELRHGRGFVQRDIDGLWGATGRVTSTS